MFAVMLRELRYLQQHKADFFMAVIAPLLVMVTPPVPLLKTARPLPPTVSPASTVSVSGVPSTP